MSNALMIEIPDEAFRFLKELAEKQGKTPEQLGLEWLSAEVRRAEIRAALFENGDKQTIESKPSDSSDPLDQCIGAFKSGMPGWSDRHDDLIGEALAREMRGQDDA